MENKLEWLSEEEGRITFFENGECFLKAEVFRFGDEEAEIRIQDIVVPENHTKNDNLRENITKKMTSCILEAFRRLEKEGMTESTVVEQGGSHMAEILDSTGVVSVAYKEYMMKRRISQHKSTDCGFNSLSLTKTSDGYDCNNKEKTFFCRLLPYQGTPSGENAFYLYEVEVSKKIRNRGVATSCLTELFRRLSSEAAVTIYLQVGSYNEPAVHLYEKLGFEICEELCCYVRKE